MIGNCKGPVWRQDDFTACFRYDWLQSIIPIALTLLSAFYLSIQLIVSVRRDRKHNSYKSFNSNGLNGNHVPQDSSRYLDESSDDDSNADRSDGETDDDLDSGGFIALSQTRTRDSIIELNRPRGELFLVTLEELAVVSQLVVHIIIFARETFGKKGRVASICLVVVWAYITVLASLRLLLSAKIRSKFTRLWYHTAFLYGFLWIANTLAFRSEMIHPRSGQSRGLAVADFVLLTILMIIALTSRKGNKAVKLEWEGDIEPSKEQLASVFSLGTFGWVDPIVWRGYKKTFEMSDVWNLPPKDKAANLLAQYRQVKKTSSLAFHLLRYFKRGIIIQALWAALSGFLTFAPTLLLKAILEYIEDPSSTPRNAAWLYVILLFVSGCVQAVADGQALWIGRKICIRLRAIIIGEIYAKALKRRVGTTTDKVLGSVVKAEDKGQISLARRMLGLGKKKSKMLKQDTASASKETEPAADAQVTSGTIINLMAVDSFKVSEICAYLHFLWASTPVQFVGTIALLYGVLGYSSFVGIAMMAFLLPINMIISKQFAKLQKEILAATDARINITNEVLSNIRIIKFFAWEQRFMSMVDEKRKVELKKIMRRYMVWAFAGTVWSGSPIVITLLTFTVYTRWEKKQLVPSIAFTGLSLFQILRIPLDQLADMVAHVQESKVSVDRVEEYLNEPETDKFHQLHNEEFDENGDPLLGFDDATFSWGSKGDAGTEAFRLLDLDFLFHPGRLNIIVGHTGSGKTSLLMALLGEMTLLGGFVHLPGAKSREDLKPDRITGLTESIAYCAQQAWLINASIKENITFATPWDPARYRDVIMACSLQRDLEILDAGDETLVGEKGVTLSGGQKQRISLARALYSRARHILLDDVLSAVDSHTAKWIFEQAILGPLMSNRTCILVTHNVTLCMPYADFGVVLDNGRVTAKGTLQDIVHANVLDEDLSKSMTVSRAPSRIASRVPSEVADESMEQAASKAAAEAALTGDADAIKSGKPAQTDQEENKAIGGVKLGIILLYFAAMGSWLYWSVALMVFVAQQFISVATNIWIRQWANAYSQRQAVSQDRTATFSSFSHISATTCSKHGICSFSMPFSPRASVNTSTATHNDEVNDWYYISVYAIIGLLLVTSVFVREIVLFYGSITASKRIHTRLMQSVMHAKFRFFDSTPLGQIMNRFSKDIESIDQEVTPVAVGLMYCFLSIMTIVVLISIITPGFLIAGAFISILYLAIGMVYISSSRDLKRLESVKRSPLYQQFGETLTGMVTIRAYGDERRFIRENLARINTQNRPFIFLWAANRWLAFRIDVVGSLVSFFSGAFVILSVGRIDAGAAGLAMTYAVTYTENMLWFVRLYAANEQNMNSVERIKEYLDVEQEAAGIVENNRPPGNWPAKGSIEFVNYSTRYREDFDLVLKDVTFKVLPGEKVGVVGRTGAGKSSMALALFRALEAQSGKILVDDIDIGLIGLQDLREKIVMVPQDPTLFSGTIRSNLDPFGLFTDEEIFTALRRTQLVGSPSPSAISTPARAATPTNADSNERSTAESSEDQHDSPSTVIGSSSTTTAQDDETRPASAADNKNIFLNLSSPITESGSNLSQGQRQLLCLARALLKDPAVLLMDEATASIDHATDGKIQETIRQLENTTVTIAHRLKTIVDYDKVLVLDHGKVIEFGEPWNLIKNEDGMFRGMCEGSGELAVLIEMAEKAREAKEA